MTMTPVGKILVDGRSREGASFLATVEVGIETGVGHALEMTAEGLMRDLGHLTRIFLWPIMKTVETEGAHGQQTATTETNDGV
jgi:hypothetical protein